MKRIYNYWSEFFIDFKIWRRYRKIARSNQDLLTENNMRVDWLGRIYTVVNMPEEVINNQETVQQGWVISQLGPMNDVLMKLGVNDYAYPEISIVPGSNSYLIVMYPEIDTLNIFRILLNLIVLGMITGLVWLVIATVQITGVINWVSNLINKNV